MSGFSWFHQWASPPVFFRRTRFWVRMLAYAFFITLLIGLYYALYRSPPDYQMGELVRIMYVHVPAAWLSLMLYAIAAGSAFAALVFRIKLGYVALRAAAEVGAVFTFVALVTGAVWGKPTWGTWWVWDARLTSELVLFFLYVGILVLMQLYPNTDRSDRSAAMLAVVGVINLPIIKYSVEWWNSLHQPASISVMGESSVQGDMLVALLIMMLSFTLLAIGLVVALMRSELLRREMNKQWVKQLVTSG